MTRLNECCPRCDFGVPDDTCKLVPEVFGRQNITVSAKPGTRSCSKTVVKRTCDKFAFRSRGKKFRCDPVEGKRVINFEKRCPLCKATYTDVTRCKIVQDNDVITGCGLIWTNTNLSQIQMQFSENYETASRYTFTTKRVHSCTVSFIDTC